MAYVQRDNSGTLFKNDRKDKDSHPDRKGTAMIDGVEYWVSGWVKTGTKGQFLSLAFKKRESRDASQGSAPSRSNDMDDQIPFAPEFR